MGRHLAAACVVLADVFLFASAHPFPAVLAYAPVAALLVLARRHRLPVFAAALGVALLTAGSYPLLIWVSYRTGLATASRRDTAVVTGAVAGWAAAMFVLRTVPETAGGCVVFVVLPLLVGRYLAQQRRLVDALESRNRQLRRERELLAEREQLRERLRISRDMHDSLGHRLSLVSVQAAALEVSGLPHPQRAAVESLATATRAAATELYELIGSLRGAPDEPARGLAATGAVVGEFRAAGVPVSMVTEGEPRPLPAQADAAAYRVVEEGLTNAAKHAPGRAVTVSLVWEPDALVVSVTNPLAAHEPGAGAGLGLIELCELASAEGQGAGLGLTELCEPASAEGQGAGLELTGLREPASAERQGAGLGLTGLRERVEPAGGFLDHRETGGRFRLVAMLPTAAPEEVPAEPEIGRVRATALGVATGALLLVLLPASMLTGVS
jgi:signal transduction histidine kinase